MRRWLCLALCLACSSSDKPADSDSGAPEATAPFSDEALDALDLTRIKADVEFLADDALAGRHPESVGHAIARDHILAEIEEIGLEPAGQDGGYLHEFDLDEPIVRYALDEDGAVVEIAATHGVNVAALLPGGDPERSSEVVVLMAHYDHLGVTEDGDAYNGAFDDAAGVAALLELARFLVAQPEPLDRSVLLLVTDMEEGGLNGARAWVEDPTVPLEDVVMAVSMDPIGRGVLPDYAPLTLMGLERAPALRARISALREFADTDVGFVNRAQIPVFKSDHDTFYEPDEPVPAFWFVSPGMTWYHTSDDTADTIDYGTVRSHLRFLAQVVGDVGNTDERFEDMGAQTLSADDCAEAAALLEGTLGSAELTDGERTTAEDLRDTLTEAAESGVIDDGVEGAYLSAAIFLILDLTESHPGEVPPAWPD